MESWRASWRDAIAPLISDAGIIALQSALDKDDSRLIQGGNTRPPLLHCVQEWECEGACAIGYTGWIGDGLTTVGEIEEYFARMCYEVDQRLGEPGGCRWFLNWHDNTPREEMRRLLLEEVNREVDNRSKK